MDFAAGRPAPRGREGQGRHRAADPRHRRAPPLRLLRLPRAAGLPPRVHRRAEEARAPLLRPALSRCSKRRGATATSTSTTPGSPPSPRCSLPGFLYSWYRPDGRLSPDEVVAELSKLGLARAGPARRALRDSPARRPLRRRDTAMSHARGSLEAPDHHGRQERALPDPASGEEALRRQHPVDRLRLAGARHVEDRAGARRHLLARHAGHAGDRGVLGRAGRRAVRREALRQEHQGHAAPPARALARPLHLRHARVDLVEAAQHPAGQLQPARDAGLPPDDAGHRRAAGHQVGAPELRRGGGRGARHDRAHARHHRPVRLRLPLQLLLPRGLPSLRRCDGAHARDGAEPARHPARGADAQEGAGAAAQGHALHAQDGGRHHPGAARERRRHRDQARPAELHDRRRRQEDRRAAGRPADPRRVHRVPDRRPRDHQRPAVLRDLFPAEQPRGDGQGAGRGRQRVRARPRR